MALPEKDQVDFGKRLADRDSSLADHESFAKKNDNANKSIKENPEEFENYRKSQVEEAEKKFEENLSPEAKAFREEERRYGPSKKNVRSQLAQPEKQRDGNQQKLSTQKSQLQAARTHEKNQQSKFSTPTNSALHAQPTLDGFYQSNKRAASLGATLRPAIRPSANFDQNILRKKSKKKKDDNLFEDEENDVETQMQNMLAQNAMKRTRFAMETSMRKQFHATQAATPEKDQQTQELAKQAAKKMIPKAAMFIANSISGVLELGTGGLAILVTFFIRFITLGWYNAEMIYGGWITKGKHKLIGPLTWDPIQMPFPKKPKGENATIPMIAVIASDLFIIFVMMLPFIYIGMIIYFFTQILP